MKIDHIALYVADLEGARRFFEKFFGAVSNEMYHNSTTGLKTYFLSFESGARLEIMNLPNMIYSDPDRKVRGYTHLAFSTGSREKVDSLTSRLEKEGYTVLSWPRVTGDGYYESCVQGFENNLIEITE